MLTDSPTSIARKIRTAVTDSIHGITYDPSGRPGVSNLLAILAAFQLRLSHTAETRDTSSGSRDEMVTLAKRYINKGSSDLKKDVTEAIIEGWRYPREDLIRLRADRSYLMQVLEDGSRRAQDLSHVTLKRVKEKIGLAVNLLR